MRAVGSESCEGSGWQTSGSRKIVNGATRACLGASEVKVGIDPKGVALRGIDSEFPTGPIEIGLHDGACGYVQKANRCKPLGLATL